MGKIIKILGTKKIKDYPILLSRRLITEENKNEAFHIHIRNMRIDFSEEEFIEFAEHIKKSLNVFKEQKGINADDGRDGSYNNYFILDQKEIKEAPSFNKNLLQIEVNDPNIIHIHFRNLRIDLSPEEFSEFGKIIRSSLEKFESK